MNLSGDPERAIKKLHITTSAKMDMRILDDAFIVFEKSAFKKTPKSGHDVRPNIFNNKFVKIAIAAAAIIIIFTVFLRRDITGGVDPGKIYKKLLKADNVSISIYQAGQTEPYQQIWTTQNIKLFRIEEQNRIQFTLWDLSKKTKMTAFLSSGTVQTETITEEMLPILDKSIIQSFGMLADIENIQEIFQWIHIDDPNIIATVPGSRVFETIPIMQTTSSVGVYRKWRVFIAIKTNLPLRTEIYVGPTPQGPFELVNFLIYTYPKTEEIEALAEKTFDPAYLRPEKPIPIGTPGM